MTTVLDEPTVESLAPESRARAVDRRRRSVRRVRAGRWLAVLVLGFVTGAAVVMLADSGTSDPSVVVNTPAAASAGPTDLNGHHIHGVKAQDVAAEAQPDVPLDPATRALLKRPAHHRA